MNRRGFLGSILLAAAAPAIVRADSLMRIMPTDTLVAFGDHTLEAEFDISFASEELATSLDEFSRLYIVPAMRRLSDGLDHEIMVRLCKPRPMYLHA